MQNNNYKYIKTCTICKKEFGSNSKTAKYCSYDCRYTANKNRTHECTCIVCGKDFQDASATNKTCSYECKNQMYTHVCRYCGKEYKSGSHQERTFCSDECRKTQLSKNCEHCGNTFISNPTKQRFCSWICEDRVIGKYEKVCSNCGKTFKTNYSNSKYCSEECKPILLRLCVCCGKVFETTGYKHNYCSQECSLDKDEYLYKLTSKGDKVILLASREELEKHFYNYDRFDNKHREFIKQKLYNIYRVKVKGPMDLKMRKIYLSRKYKPILNYYTNERHKKILELEVNNWQLIYTKNK